ncbi:MAG: gliding motility lipoprotein GldH [Bacteroidetes bacterium]|nr:gliding motility lipoprotein GldH [Bacteroidota bacterium]
MKKIFIYLSIILAVSSCARIDLFEKQQSIPSQQWFYSNTPGFTFNITDTGAAYSIYIVIRHSDQYQYNNLWVRLGSKAPSDSMRFQNINLRLASDAKGWEGSAMDDIYEVRKLISPGPVHFKSAGEYYFSIAQIMRENPLKHVFSIGLRIEKMHDN